MGRTLGLLGVVLVAGLLVLLIEAPERPLPRDAVSGPRVLKIAPAAVTRLELRLEEGRLTLRRTPEGWHAADQPAGARLREAIDALLTALAELRAIDRFRDERDAPFGLDSPLGSVTLTSDRRRTHIVLGDFNTARSGVYARRDDHPRVLVLGAYLLSAMDAVFYRFHAERDGRPAADQRPEIG